MGLNPDLMKVILPWGTTVKGAEFVTVTSADEVLAAREAGYEAGAIWWTSISENGIRQVLGECRPVAGTMEDLLLLQQAADSVPMMVSTGLHLVPDQYDDGKCNGFRIRDLPDVARQARRLSNVSIGGCCCHGNLDGVHGTALGGYFRACYETAKQMSVIFPCSMPYLILSPALEALVWNWEEHPETYNDFLRIAETVAEQNRTAFYSRMLIC